jgi:hypothetical protein
MREVFGILTLVLAPVAGYAAENGLNWAYPVGRSLRAYPGPATGSFSNPACGGVRFLNVGLVSGGGMHRH